MGNSCPCCPDPDYEKLQDPDHYHLSPSFSSSSPSSSTRTSTNYSSYLSDSSPIMSANTKTGGKYPQHMKKSPKRTPQRNNNPESTPNKFNSTSTMYINDTINSPNVDELLRCLAMRVQQHVIKGVNNPFDRHEEVFFEIFDERRYPIVKGANLAVIPGVPEIYDFIFKIFETERLSHECGILCLAYIERIMETSGIRLFPCSWRRVVLSALILASKVWEDQAVWNVDFLSVFPSVKVGDLAKLEKKILSLLRFDVSLAAKDYAQLYFDLKDLSGQGGFVLKPLNKDGKARLELRTKLSDDWTKMANESSGTGIKRSQSAEWTPPKTSNAVIN